MKRTWLTEVGAALLVLGEGSQMVAKSVDPETGKWLFLVGQLMQAVGVAAVGYRISKKVGESGKTNG